MQRCSCRNDARDRESGSENLRAGGNPACHLCRPRCGDVGVRRGRPPQCAGGRGARRPGRVCRVLHLYRGHLRAARRRVAGFGTGRACPTAGSVHVGTNAARGGGRPAAILAAGRYRSGHALAPARGRARAEDIRIADRRHDHRDGRATGVHAVRTGNHGKPACGRAQRRATAPADPGRNRRDDRDDDPVLCRAKARCGAGPTDRCAFSARIGSSGRRTGHRTARDLCSHGTDRRGICTQSRGLDRERAGSMVRAEHDGRTDLGVVGVEPRKSDLHAAQHRLRDSLGDRGARGGLCARRAAVRLAS